MRLKEGRRWKRHWKIRAALKNVWKIDDTLKKIGGISFRIDSNFQHLFARVCRNCIEFEFIDVD